ncbi:hypothetical protein H9Y04_42585 [Streptomyces sp. TRM66268-LWL]|uniref:Uncharacterized protein n=1 Tax=Streptomyces polyasparticus TaxID=2767826 RepID=A0ABR7SUR9_9ACTN|nr:hypothetical protein [Streptomyces polyasparticus]MBC9719220.1 hypothetical protein [Streptomyces polyasparticus]
MRKLKRSTSAAILVATLAGTAALATAAPATAASYQCKTSTKSVDDAAYDGIWADNWDFSAKVCAKQSGDYLYSYASISWDGPVIYEIDDSSIFDGAYFKVQAKKSVPGTDPVLKSANYHGIESRLENSSSNANYNNHYTTPVMKTKVGSAPVLTDGELYLDWNNDGNGYGRHQFTASPVV